MDLPNNVCNSDISKINKKSIINVNSTVISKTIKIFILRFNVKPHDFTSKIKSF